MNTIPRLLFLAFACPAVGLAEEGVAALVRRLASPEWKTREAATQALARMGEAAEAPLRAALASAQDLETRRRIEGLLARIHEAAVEKERQANLAAFWNLRRTLREDHEGQWVVIAAGRRIALTADYRGAIQTAAPATASARHRFVFRAGSEPGYDTEGYSEELLPAPGVIRVRPVSGVFWFAGGEMRVIARGRLFDNPTFFLADPERPDRVLSRGLSWPFTDDRYNDGQLKLASTANLDLARREVPGTIRAHGGQRLFRRSWVLVGIDGQAAAEPLEVLVPP